VSGLRPIVFRVAYARLGELRDDLEHQLRRGGLLVKVPDSAGLTLDDLVSLELVLPDGAALLGASRVIQVLSGAGVAVSAAPEFVDEVERCVAALAHRGDPPGAGPARHACIRAAGTAPLGPRAARPTPRPTPTPTPTSTAPSSAGPAPRRPTPMPGLTDPPLAVSARATPRAITAPTLPGATAAPPGAPTRAEKIQLALHGSRDERNAILRDRDRTLHPFVLKNPQLDAEDALAIAKNAQLAPELLKLLGERKEWLQRPAIAAALVRNPKTPPELAFRALDHLPVETLRQLAKGAGVMPHISQAARKKLLG